MRGIKENNEHYERGENKKENESSIEGGGNIYVISSYFFV